MSTEFNTPELPAIGFLAAMPQEDREILSSFGEFLPVHKDQDLITEGQPQDSLYFVISGLLHVHSNNQGRRTLLGSAKQGDVLGEISVFDPDDASANVTAVEFSQVWRINREMLEEVLNEYPSVGNLLLIQIATQLSRRMRATNKKVISAQQAIGDSIYWVF
jgi:CRP-like cAMP-binding protein